ncbi:hypothetical protein PACTADRAFT_47856 [Pachysolen tannophilus NRRL Y-2460]|uniref:Glutamyl-tRNA(Gln) amidotransferase subunit B, mitochondrial n=1 Tax=Pachysolen tannophilus NRRL Y-2460 TaxID=669874 RepID=A0A1E4U201_PACTA|nr:hypothetical protein PACTADRAFT_47856 [Pachysolen tannophilus NRRL Y-2460]
MFLKKVKGQLIIRQFSQAIAFSNKNQETFKFLKDYKLKCGLEIHTQLDTSKKLFSLSPTSFNERQNTRVSYFDVSLPGTQPRLNPEALLYTLKAAVVLNSKINPISTFDRKHYFYGDQPLGYQITQHYNPISKGGYITLTKEFDEINEVQKIINIEQIQIEQDTGKSMYKNQDGNSQIDLNRSNMPLIELVTKPDFEDLKQVKAFIKKFQLLFKILKICTGDLETGAIRVDVNLSVNNGERIEIKNLSSTSAILNAIKYEYNRQVELIKQGNPIISKETRGWDGFQTVKLRNKETAVDYRYMPDPELPPIVLDLADLIPNISSNIPELPEEQLLKLSSKPHNCKLRDSRILVQNQPLLNYYLTLFELLKEQNIKNLDKLSVNWCCHELLGALTKLDLEFDHNLLPATKLAELIIQVSHKAITNNNAKLLLLHLLNNKEDLNKSIPELIEEYELGMDKLSEQEIVEFIDEVLKDPKNSKIVETIQRGEKPKSINYLIGQCMRLSSGKVDSKVFEHHLTKRFKT